MCVFTFWPVAFFIHPIFCVFFGVDFCCNITFAKFSMVGNSKRACKRAAAMRTRLSTLTRNRGLSIRRWEKGAECQNLFRSPGASWCLVVRSCVAPDATHRVLAHCRLKMWHQRTRSITALTWEQVMIWRRSYDTLPPPVAKDSEYHPANDPM